MLIAVVERTRKGYSTDARRAWHRLCPLQFLTGAANTKFDGTDFRNVVPRFTPKARKANQALVDLLGEITARKQGDASPDRARLAFGAKAADRPGDRYPAHLQARVGR